VRTLAVLLQIAIPGVLGGFPVIMLGLGLVRPIATPDRSGFLQLIVYGGAAVGVAAWFLGLIVDRASPMRLLLTVAGSILGLTVSYLLLEHARWAEVSAPLLHVATGPLAYLAAFPAPLAGALAGYYWLWPKLQMDGQ
jgi:hypothetical protein